MQEWRGKIDFLLFAGGHLDICRHCETVSERDVFRKVPEECKHFSLTEEFTQNRKYLSVNHPHVICQIFQTHI